MSDAKCYFQRQYGYDIKWRHHNGIFRQLRSAVKVFTPEDEDEIYEPPIFACRFAEKQGYEHILALADESGNVLIHDTEKQIRTTRENVHSNAIFDLAWMCDQMRFVTVSGDHTAQLYHIAESRILKEVIYVGHSRSVKTVAFNRHTSSVFATGSRDGHISLWDVRDQPTSGMCFPDIKIYYAHITEKIRKRNKSYYSTPKVSAESSVTDLVFQDDLSLISCSAGDGIIKIWDTRKSYRSYDKSPVPKYTLPYGGNSLRRGYSSLILDPTGMKLYANCLDSTIYCYNIGTYYPEPVMMYIGHTNNNYFIKTSLSNDGRHLISGSTNHKAYIWDVANPYPVAELTGHANEVTCVAWRATHEPFVVTCSDDLTHKFWKVYDNPGFYGDEAFGGLARTPEIKKDKLSLKDLKKNHNSRPKKMTKKQTAENRYRSKYNTALDLFDTNIPSTSTASANLSPPTQNRAGNPLQLVERFRSTRKSLGVVQDKAEGKMGVSCFCKNLGDGLVGETNLLGPPKKKLRISGRKEECCDNCRQLVLADPEVGQPISDQPSSSQRISSAIAMLPNYVLDGLAPHINISPQKKADKDWLTKLQIQKKSIRKSNLFTPSPLKKQKIDTLTVGNRSPRTPRTPKTGYSTPKNPLLKFFKVTNNSGNQSPGQKSPKVGSQSPVPQSSQ